MQWLEDWVTIQWKLYRDVAVWTCGCWGVCVAIHQVYRDMRGGLVGGKLCHNTSNCIVTRGLLAGRVTIQSSVS